MNIGVVCIWWNRGQATVGRHLRSIFEELGHKTFVLARPVREKGPLKGAIATSDIWDQPGVTHASTFLFPAEELLTWAKENQLDAVFFHQNYLFDSIAELRATGVKTFGLFVWEKFSQQHVEDTQRAFDVVVSVTEIEAKRYGEFGIDSPFIRWGCHPELADRKPARRGRKITFFFPGAGKRMLIDETIDAFLKVRPRRSRLLIKTQSNRREVKIPKHRSIVHVNEDMDFDKYHKLFSTCHVCVCPTRWEGMGLHLYEAISHGIPILVNDIPPINEVVKHGFNGYLARAPENGVTKSGVPAFDVDALDLAEGIRQMADPEQLDGFLARTSKMKEILAWDRTVERFALLLDRYL